MTPSSPLARFPEYIGYIVVCLLSAGITAMAIRFLAARAGNLGLVDHPDGIRKKHSRPTPLVGGIAMVAGVFLSSVPFISGSSNNGMVFSLLLITAIGVLDDRFNINFKIRLLMQIGAVLLIVMFDGVALNSFGSLFGQDPIVTGRLAIPVTIFCVVGVINALNMLDGHDGLAGGVALVAFISFGALAMLNGLQVLVLIALAFCGALLAFLRSNWFPSKIFMGDAGSMSLGLALACFSLQLTQFPGTTVSPAAALLVLSLPVTDTLTVMIKRIMKRQNPFHPDRNHLHHVLKALGFSDRNVTLTIMTLCLLSGTIAVAGTILHAHDAVLFLIFVICFLTYFIASYNVRFFCKIIVKIRQKSTDRAEPEKLLN